MGNRAAAWAVAGPLIAFKIWVIVLILMVAPHDDAVGFLVATNWPLLVVIGLLVAGPALAWWRLVRVRARRGRLRRAEWELEPPSVQPAQSAADVPSQWPLWETVARLEGRG